MLVRTATRFSPNGHRRGSRAAEKTEGAATASSADTDAGDEDSDKRRTSGVRWRKVRPPSGHLSSPERPNSAESAIPVPHTGSGGRTAPEAGRTAGPETKAPNEVGSRSAKNRQRQKIIRSSGGSEKCAPPYNRRRRKSPEPTARFAETTSSPARTALFGLPDRRNRGFPGGIHEAPPIFGAIVPRHPKEHGAAHLAHRNAESETTPRKGKTGDSPPRFSPAFGQRAYKYAQKRKTRRIAGIFPAQIFAAR